MARVTITAGTGEDRHGVPLSSSSVALALATIRGHLAATFGGFTETDTLGGWVDDGGRLVMEQGKRWTILADVPREEAAAQAEVVRRALNQAAVVLEFEPDVSGQFIAAPVVKRREVA